MGAHPYWYTVKYRPEIDAALAELRQREFLAGRYNPVMPFIDFPITPASQAPGAQHKTIAAACADAEEDGTRSILDIDAISDEPEFGAATPLAPDLLESLYGTTEPTAEMVENNMDFLEEVDRGQAVYIVCYTAGTPSHILFAGYSFD
jgi:hypothetical protein